MVHGGIHVTGNKTLEIQSPRVFREFINRGWCVITMNYLLGPHALVSDMLDDLVDAYAFLHEHLAHKFPIDINNIHLFGQSSAGALVLLCGRLFQPRPKSVVAMYPLTDYMTNYIYVKPLKSDSLFLNLHRRLSKQPVQESPVLESLINNPRILTNPEEFSLMPRLRYSVYFLVNTSYFWAYVTHDVSMDESTIRIRLAAMSPIANVDDRFPPTYCAHGTGDTGVNYMDTVAFVRVLRLHNIPCVLYLAPELPHSFDVDEVADNVWYPHVLPAFDFLQKYIDKNAETDSK
ncbi:unnamed protein product [Adineta steineri]|uniref:BD-FAE-like domain-containing protein n=1 Tax=Adineta steineri TaxID=433720 RepID=A0A815N0F0_9BILA|nr:unnamed protein product [Adineta steineri]CAF3812064.1 unnamed protein product [Adineta steineri]